MTPRLRTFARLALAVLLVGLLVAYLARAGSRVVAIAAGIATIAVIAADEWVYRKRRLAGPSRLDESRARRVQQLFALLAAVGLLAWAAFDQRMRMW
jgi:hypothetical protein